MAEIQKNYDSFARFKTKVFGISTDFPEQSEALVSNMNLSFDLLCDFERTMISQYDLLNRFEHGGIAYPAVFILNPEGEICYRSLDGTAQRIDLSEIYSFLDAFVTTADYSSKTPGKKKLIVPSLRSLFMITRNMLFRGNFSDWKHYILFPFTITRLTLRSLFKKR